MTAGVFHAAQTYLSAGLKILPLAKAGKIPVGTWERWRTTPLPHEACREAFLERGCNVGIITGAPSGLTVIDCDTRADARAFVAWLANQPGKIAERTPIVATPRGGHFYFAYGGEGNGVRHEHDGFGFDVRADGGYVVAPPSTTSRGSYKVVSHCGVSSSPPPLPASLAAALAPAPAGTKVFEGRSIINTIPEGGRNNALASLYGYLLHHGVDVHAAGVLVHSYNTTGCKPPLPAAEVDRIIDSIYARERSKGGR